MPLFSGIHSKKQRGKPLGCNLDTSIGNKCFEAKKVQSKHLDNEVGFEPSHVQTSLSHADTMEKTYHAGAILFPLYFSPKRRPKQVG